MIEQVIIYAKTLIGIPYRWHGSEPFPLDDKFWVENSSPPTADEIREADKSIVCTGLINLMRRYQSLPIPGIDGNIKGKYRELYKQFPGGTGAWYLYLHQQKKIEKLDINARYPVGTLVLARYVSDEVDQGHVAVIIDDEGKTIREQNIIHSWPDIEYNNRNLELNHGSVRIEPFHVSNDKWKAPNSKVYYKYVCLPEKWLLLD
jgi:hypothetical protein